MSKAPQSATLHAAAGKGGVELMRQMLAAGRVEVNALDRFGASALLYAAGGGHEQAVQLLLDFTASLSAHSADGDTPLHAAARTPTALPQYPSTAHGRRRVPPLALASAKMSLED